MKRFVALVLQVVAILAFTGSSLGDGDGGAEILPPPCPVILDKGKRMDRKIFEMGRKCIATENDLTLLGNYRTKQEHQDFFRTYCEKEPQILACLADVARKSQLCQNETRHQYFQVFRELLETTLNVGCYEEGVILVDIVMISKQNTTIPTNDISFHKCLTFHFKKVSHSFRLDVSDFSRNYMFYRDLKLAKECFNNISGEDQNIKDGIVTLLSVILIKYKCFNPQDDSVVFCKNLDPKQDVSNRSCPVKSVDEQSKPLYNSFLEQLPILLSVIDSEYHQGLTHFENRELTGKFFKLACDKKNLVQRFLKDAAELASFCLDNAHKLMFQTVVTFMENVFDQLCAGDGRYVADVVFKAFSDIANSTDLNALRKCKDIVLPSTERIGRNFTSEKTLEYYQKLKVFKVCLVNKLQGDDVAVSSAELILNGVINNMKCPNPENTSLVLCETIAKTKTVCVCV